MRLTLTHPISLTTSIDHDDALIALDLTSADRSTGHGPEVRILSATVPDPSGHSIDVSALLTARSREQIEAAALEQAADESERDYDAEADSRRDAERDMDWLERDAA